MNIRFYDRQDSSSPLSGAVFETAAEVRDALERVRGRAPFFAELIGDNGYKLLLGLSADMCCVQFSAVDGSPPYLMAVAPDAEAVEGEVEFLIANTMSPVPRRYCLTRAAIVDIAAEFARTGQRKADVPWEEI